MNYMLATDWSSLPGRRVELRKDGQPVRSGYVEAVTCDSGVLWLEFDGFHPRALFESAEGFEAWVEPVNRQAPSPDRQLSEATGPE